MRGGLGQVELEKLERVQESGLNLHQPSQTLQKYPSKERSRDHSWPRLSPILLMPPQMSGREVLSRLNFKWLTSNLLYPQLEAVKRLETSIGTSQSLIILVNQIRQ